MGQNLGAAMKVIVRSIGIVLLLGVLAACSTLRLSYNNAETALRFLAWDYLDIDTDQADFLQDQFARLRNWHRSNELPAYVSTVRAAKEKFTKGVSRADIEWATASIRGHFRVVAERAARDAAPVLVTLRAEQIGALEKKFSRENTRFSERWIAGEEKSRYRRRVDRLVEQVEDWTGRLAPAQRALIERFVSMHPGDFERRLEERRRWQQAALALLKRHKSAPELAVPLARLFAEPEIGRPKQYVQDMRSWESDLVELIVDLNVTLGPDQRARVIRRLDRYSDDFRALSGVRPAN
jgi:hypothetical protein